MTVCVFGVGGDRPNTQREQNLRHLLTLLNEDDASKIPTSNTKS